MLERLSYTPDDPSEAKGKPTVPVIKITRDTSGNVIDVVLMQEPMSDAEIKTWSKIKQNQIRRGIENLRVKPLDLGTYANISRDVVNGDISLNDLNITVEEFVAKRKVARIHNAREKLLQAGNGTYEDIQVLIEKGHFTLADLGMSEEEFKAGQKAARIKDALLQIEESNNGDPILYPAIFDQITEGQFTLQDLEITQDEFINRAHLSTPDKFFLRH